MRVLMVSSLWPPEVLGGAEQYGAALTQRLRAAGHVVGVVTLGVEGDDVVAQIPSWPYPIREYERQPALRRALFHASDIGRPDTRRVMERALDEFRPDVVHSHVVQGMSAAALTAPGRRRIGHVHTLHDYWLVCQRNSMVQRDGTVCVTLCASCRAIGGMRNHQIARHAPDVVIAVSEAVARPHLAHVAWMRGRTRVVYNPVEDPHPEKANRTPGAPITFGYFGRLGRDKGILTLLAAFDLAAFGRVGVDGYGVDGDLAAGGSVHDSTLGRARLVIAGRGAEETAVRAAAAADSRVEYRGWVNAAAKDALFAELDALVVPSLWQDPAPLVVNEARARGLAVIGTRVGGIPELIAPTSEPLLVPPNDQNALAAALTTFASNPDGFRATPETVPTDWRAHLVAIERAYADAMASAATAEATPWRGRH